MKNFKLLMVFLLIHFHQLYSQNYNWKTLKTGAGGWVTGMDIHPSGEPKFCRVDVGSAYRYDTSTQTWKNIVTALNLPIDDVDWFFYGGVLSIASAPSNNNIVYMAYHNGIYKSNNKGDIWTKTNFPSTPMPSNQDASKYSGERLSVDPANANIVYFGSINNGLWKTENAGENWTQITSLPNGISERGVRQLVFDPTSVVSEGKTLDIYVTIDGEGVFKSTNAGMTWNNISSGNFNGISDPIFLDTAIDSSGKLYITGYDAQNEGNSLGIYRYNDANWQQLISNPTAVIFNIAIDPFDNKNVFGFSYGGGTIYRTTNANQTTPTWDYPSYTRTNGQIGWLGFADSYYFTIGEAQFDPIIPNKLWISEGVGVWNCTNLYDNDLTWIENSNGQEHLVSNDIVINATGKAVTCHWDRAIFYHQNNDTYPLTQKPSSKFNSAWDMDVCPTNLNFIVAIIEDHRYCCYDNETRSSGYSEDGGLTWTEFATQPDNANLNGIFGNIAVSANDVNNIVWLPSYNESPYYTTNKGLTWTQVNFPNDLGNCCHGANFINKKVLVADQVLSNTFYVYNWENSSIYRSTNGGASWTEYTNLGDYGAWHGKLRATPEHAGHLWFAHAYENYFDGMQPLKRSVDGGINWVSLTNTSKVINVAIGKPAIGSNYPTIFIQGKVNDVQGYWMSIDQGNNWTQIGDYPLGIYDVAKVMEGDRSIFGRLYVGFSGNGFVYGDLDENLDIENQILTQKELKIYPNPATNEIKIDSKNRNQSLKIVDISGREILKFSKIPQSIKIDKLINGLYFLICNGQTIKFIKN